MTRVLVDTNVVLDVLLDRKPHVTASLAVWSAVETRALQGLLAAHAITTIHYLIRKERGSVQAKRVVSGLLRIFGIAPVDVAVIQDALQLSSPDFEDSVTASAAKLAGCEAIVTRDPKGFRGSSIRVLTPEAAAPFIGKT
jgi:predicted nucleic acid-binding protein